MFIPPGLVPEQTCSLPQAGTHRQRQPPQQVPTETPAEAPAEPSSRGHHDRHCRHVCQLLPTMWCQSFPSHADVSTACLSLHVWFCISSQLHSEYLICFFSEWRHGGCWCLTHHLSLSWILTRLQRQGLHSALRLHDGVKPQRCRCIHGDTLRPRLPHHRYPGDAEVGGV